MINDRVFTRQIRRVVRQSWDRVPHTWEYVVMMIRLLQRQQHFAMGHALYSLQSVLDGVLIDASAQRWHQLNKLSVLYDLYRVSCLEAVLESSRDLMRLGLNRRYLFQRLGLPASLERLIWSFVVGDIEKECYLSECRQLRQSQQTVKHLAQTLMQAVYQSYDMTSRRGRLSYSSWVLAHAVVGLELMTVFIPLEGFVRHEQLIFLAPFFAGIMLMQFQYINYLVALLLAHCDVSFGEELTYVYAKYNLLQYASDALGFSKHWVPPSIEKALQNIRRNWKDCNQLQHEWEKAEPKLK